MDRKQSWQSEAGTGLIELGLPVRSDRCRFTLVPPLPLDLSFKTERHLLLSPFASAAVELKVDGDRYRPGRLRGGSLTLLVPNTKVRLGIEDPVELLVVEPDEELVRASTSAGRRSWTPVTLIGLADPAAAALGTELRRSLLNDRPSELSYAEAIAQALLVRAGCHILSDLETASDRREALSPVILSRVMSYIDTHLAEEVRVDTLAEIAGLSRSHFTRAFHNLTGDPPQRYLMKRRICRVRDLLSSDERSLAQIAAATGFSSQSHLSTAFHQSVGTTPARYRAAFGKRRMPSATAQVRSD